MANEMIERVARAIAKAQRPAFELEDDSRDIELYLYGGEKVDCTALARAAIDAMREPTEAMIERGREQTAGDWTDDGRSSARACWEVMIDTILSESS